MDDFEEKLITNAAMPNLAWTLYSSALLASVCTVDLQTKQKYPHHGITIKSERTQGKNVFTCHMSQLSKVLPKDLLREEP
jgi:hypothetical protein